MPFFTKNSFDEKLAQKSFKLLKRLKVPSADELKFQSLLCADSSFMLSELILCTNQAVFYLPHLRNAFNQYDFSSITAVTIEDVKAYPSVCLTISNGGTSKLYVATKEASKMADYIKSKISYSASNSATSAADEIMKYKQLLDCGAITETEYEAKKKQLLGL